MNLARGVVKKMAWCLPWTGFTLLTREVSLSWSPVCLGTDANTIKIKHFQTGLHLVVMLLALWCRLS